MTVSKDTVALLLQRMGDVADPEWYQALVMRYQDETGSLEEAIDRADAALADCPTPDMETV